MLSSFNDDYRLFINEKLMEYLPTNKVIRGDDVNFRCMLCGDSKKSSIKKRAHYSLSKGIFHCFNCDASMTGLKLLEYLSGSDFDEIKSEYIRMKVKVENKQFNSRPIEILDNSKFNFNDIVQIVDPKWKNPLSDLAKEYLTKRKVLEAPFLKEKFYSYFAKNGLEYILIPWKLNGIEGYYQLNDFQKKDKYGRKYIFPKKDKIVYGLDNIDISFPYVICLEGVYDSLFVKNGICIGGKSLSDLQKEIIHKRYPKHQIVLSYDNDQPGFESYMKIVKRNPSEFKFFKWFNTNTSEKDINDRVLKLNDPKIFSEKETVERNIVSAIQMKMFLMEKGIWK